MNTIITSNVFITEIPRLMTVLNDPSLSSALSALSASSVRSAASTHKYRPTGVVC
jgi:hypothetical protein